MHLNLVDRAYRAPYAWVPQCETPRETASQRLDVTTFRVPGAAAIGRDRVVESGGTDGSQPGSAFCVTTDDEGAARLGAGG